MALDELAMRKAARANMSLEGRQIEALEMIADALVEIRSELAGLRNAAQSLARAGANKSSYGGR